MIQSKEDYILYLEADRKALKKKRSRPRLVGDDIWKFQRLLRKVEYFHNCRKSILSRIRLKYLNYKLYKQSLSLGFYIHLNAFGTGLSIAWSGPIVVYAKIGANCRISQGVTIGRTPGRNGIPELGDNVFIGPNAVIVGPIEIADNIMIGANSFVNRSFTEPGITIAGVPAKKVSDYRPREEAQQQPESAF